jgi:hypothetical protein
MSNQQTPPAPLAGAAFHGPLGEFVRRLEPHTEADPVAILVQGLVGFGNAIGRTAHFIVEADKHFCVLNCVLVGETSKARKGVSWRRVQSLISKVDPTWPKPASGLSSGEGLIHAVRDGTPKPDGDEQEWGVLDKRLLVIEEEFARPLVCAARENNILSAVIRCAFDTGDLRNLTRNSPDIATGAHISFIGHITRQELMMRLKKTDTANGFANRFLWPFVRRSQELPEGGQSHTLDFSDLEQKLKAARAFCLPAREFRRDPDAGERWQADYSRLSRGRPGLLGGITSRGEAYVMRLALVYAVLDCSPTIKLSHLEAAFAVWTYCADSARYIFGDSLGDPDADAILNALRSAGVKGLTRTEISRLVFNGNKSADVIEHALQLLAYHYLVEKRMVPTEGRDAETWFIR